MLKTNILIDQNNQQSNIDVKNVPLVVILGETATGKTELAIEVARRINGEVINADSWIIRKEVNIGAAKPSAYQLQQVKHYLIDCIEPNQYFSVAKYKAMALSTINKIHKNQKIPIMVGGSGLYINSVIYNYTFRKNIQANKTLRNDLNQLSQEQLKDIAISQNLNLKEIDSNNKRRIIRLIETNKGNINNDKLRKNTVLIGVKMDKDIHQKMIIKRIDNMIKKGLEQEAKVLSKKYGWDSEICKGVGYAQWKDYFNNKQSLDDTRLKIIQATKNLAKKQRTWFKKNNNIKWFNYPLNVDTIIEYITTNVNI
ncbi:MAG: tRNA (adenosine(37)-N6)-dimethylallyltransferase MiaA [Patescibacteria group bacterium]|jgi:tRNA dimethylallyltransferase|nr:tRNA (adenosine(37)-N6)-dimethylallyltransferase MiaA [Patescibacteria group bacterium]